MTEAKIIVKNVLKNELNLLAINMDDARAEFKDEFASYKKMGGLARTAIVLRHAAGC